MRQTLSIQAILCKLSITGRSINAFVTEQIMDEIYKFIQSLWVIQLKIFVSISSIFCYESDENLQGLIYVRSVFLKKVTH